MLKLSTEKDQYNTRIQFKMKQKIFKNTPKMLTIKLNLDNTCGHEYNKTRIESQH